MGQVTAPEVETAALRSLNNKSSAIAPRASPEALAPQDEAPRDLRIGWPRRPSRTWGSESAGFGSG